MDGIEHGLDYPMLFVINFEFINNFPSGKRLVTLQVPKLSNVTKSVKSNWVALFLKKPNPMP